MDRIQRNVNFWRPAYFPTINIRETGHSSQHLGGIDSAGLSTTRLVQAQSFETLTDERIPLDEVSPSSTANQLLSTNIVASSDVALVEHRPSTPAPFEPYHVLSKTKRWHIVAIIGAAGLFSGLSSNIYFPALDTIAQDLKIPLQQVSLSMMSYLIAQAVCPIFWGVLADTIGRRPTYIASFAVYIMANVGLSFTPNFTLLVFFRALQAAGSASTVSIGNGVIQDITAPADRGSFIGFYQAIRNFSIAIGPVLGGAINNFWGFRAIFVVLLIMSSVVFAVLVILLPETLRSIAGNGSVRLTGAYEPLIHYLTVKSNDKPDLTETVAHRRLTTKDFTAPFKLLAEKDIIPNLLFGGVVYTVWSMVTATTTGLFKSTFGLNALLLGIIFLPNGIGTIIGSAIVGKLMSRDFKATERGYKLKHGLAPDHQISPKDLPADFPIEHARLRQLPWIVAVFVISVGIYGFSLQYPQVTSRPGWIAVPLLLQFVISGTSNAVFAVNQTLITDLSPGKGASSTAINNLVRCGLGAFGVALSEKLVADAGPGFTFLGLSLLTVGVFPLFVISWHFGMQWRAERTRRADTLNA